LVHITTSQLLVEVIENVVNVHALAYFFLKLSDNNWDFSDVLFGLSKLFDIFGDSSDALVDFIEFS
jgi:hypothetical protein